MFALGRLLFGYQPAPQIECAPGEDGDELNDIDFGDDDDQDMEAEDAESVQYQPPTQCRFVPVDEISHEAYEAAVNQGESIKAWRKDATGRLWARWTTPREIRGV